MALCKNCVANLASELLNQKGGCMHLRVVVHVVEQGLRGDGRDAVHLHLDVVVALGADILFLKHESRILRYCWDV